MSEKTTERELGDFENWPADFFKPPTVPLGGHIPGITDVVVSKPVEVIETSSI
jgi:hypothetical protein